jgi:hypothetical protein
VPHGQRWNVKDLTPLFPRLSSGRRPKLGRRVRAAGRAGLKSRGGRPHLGDEYTAASSGCSPTSATASSRARTGSRSTSIATACRRGSRPAVRRRRGSVSGPWSRTTRTSTDFAGAWLRMLHAEPAHDGFTVVVPSRTNYTLAGRSRSFVASAMARTWSARSPARRGWIGTDAGAVRGAIGRCVVDWVASERRCPWCPRSGWPWCRRPGGRRRPRRPNHQRTGGKRSRTVRQTGQTRRPGRAMAARRPHGGGACRRARTWPVSFPVLERERIASRRSAM